MFSTCCVVLYISPEFLFSARRSELNYILRELLDIRWDYNYIRRELCFRNRNIFYVILHLPYIRRSQRTGWSSHVPPGFPRPPPPTNRDLLYLMIKLVGHLLKLCFTISFIIFISMMCLSFFSGLSILSYYL